PATRAVFPPANVPAQLAFDAVMRSPRAAVNRAESWSARVPLVTGLFSSELWDRQYSRAEIAGLPKDFDRLGLVLHLAQDLAVPQHAEGTADYCHHELEQLIDRLACKSGANIDPLPYNRGTYSANEYPDCQNLYDEKLVAKILSEQPFLNPLSDLKVSGRLTELAKVSARWQWGDPSDSVDMLGTMLPDGMEITGDTCEQILRDPAIEPQIRFQYNLGVAVSASIFELAAHRYKSPQLLE
ncbi:MAG: hypothetical protein ACXVCH_17500, partial [Bdellovibrionota bacterium]